MSKNTEEKSAIGAIESTAKAAIEQGEKVWLAGLGVLARAQDDGRDWIGADKVKLFDELVDAGREFADSARKSGEDQFASARETVRDAFETAREQARSNYDRVISQTETSVEKVSESLGIEQIFDRRVERAMKRLGYPSARQLKTLTKKVNDLQPKKKAAASKAKTKKSA